MAVLVTTWFGVFVLDEKSGKILAQKLMPKDPKEIAEKLSAVQRGMVIPEEIELASTFPKISVSNSRQSELGKPAYYDLPVLDPEKFGFDKDLMHKTMIDLAKLRTSEPIPRDKNLVHAIRGLDDLIETVNLLNERLHEWYGMHFPELSDIARDERYAQLISEFGDRDSILDELGLELSSLGADLDNRDMIAVKDLAETVLQAYREKETIESYVTEIAEEVAPNMHFLIGAPLTARLISLAGGLERLSTLPSSTVQLLGAEKAMFRHLRSGKNPPKHGIIYQYPDVHSSPYWQRGKIARSLAGKILIAAKIDAYGGEFRGDKLKDDLDARIADIRKRYPDPPQKPKKNNFNKKRGNKPRR